MNCGQNLILTSSNHTEIRIQPNQTITLGRDVRADHVVTDVKLSSLHFSIENADDPVIRELGSTNGTYVNGRRISCCKVLFSGDVIVAGQTVFRVEFQECALLEIQHSDHNSTLVALCD